MFSILLIHITMYINEITKNIELRHLKQITLHYNITIAMSFGL